MLEAVLNSRRLLMKGVGETIVVNKDSGWMIDSWELFLKSYIQSEIILEFSRKKSPNPPLNCRSLFRNVKRFQL